MLLMNQWNQKLAERFVEYVKKNQVVNAIQEVKIKYSFCVILGEIEKLGVLLAFYLLIGRIKEFFIILMVLSVTKHFTGGVHLKRVETCFGITLFASGIIIVCGIQICITNIIRLMIYATSAVLMALFAPIQAEQHLVMDKSQAYCIKVKGVLWVILLVILTEFVQIDKKDYVTWTVLCVEIDLLIGKLLEKRRNRLNERKGN